MALTDSASNIARAKGRNQDWLNRIMGSISDDEIANLQTSATDSSGAIDQDEYAKALSALVGGKGRSLGTSGAFAGWLGQLAPAAKALTQLEGLSKGGNNLADLQNTSLLGRGFLNTLGKVASGGFGGSIGNVNLQGNPYIQHLWNSALGMRDYNSQGAGAGGDYVQGTTDMYQDILETLLPMMNRGFERQTRQSLADTRLSQVSQDPLGSWLDFWQANNLGSQFGLR